MVAVGLQVLGAFGVAFNLAVVDAAVEFNDQFAGGRVEIQNELSHRGLAAELGIRYLSSAQRLPQRFLGERGFLPHLLGNLLNVLRDVTNSHSIIPPYFYPVHQLRQVANQIEPHSTADEFELCPQ